MSGVTSGAPGEGQSSPGAPIGDPGAAAAEGSARDATPGGPVRRSIHALSTAFAVLAAVLVMAIMFSTAADVTVRQITGASIPGVVEYSEVLMVGLIFLGLAYAQRCGAHIGVDLVVQRLPARVGHVVASVGLMIAIAVVALMAWETLGVALQSFETREFRFGLVQVPIWPARALIPIGLVALLLELAVTLSDEIAALRHRPAAPSGSEPTPTSQDAGGAR